MKKVFILFSIFIFFFGLSFFGLPTKGEAYFGVSLNFGINAGFNNNNYYGGSWRDGQVGCRYNYCGLYTSYGGDYNPAFMGFDNYGYAGLPMTYSNRATTSYNSRGYNNYNSRGSRQGYYTPGFTEICTYNCY